MASSHLLLTPLNSRLSTAFRVDLNTSQPRSSTGEKEGSYHKGGRLTGTDPYAVGRLNLLAMALQEDDTATAPWHSFIPKYEGLEEVQLSLD